MCKKTKKSKKKLSMPERVNYQENFVLYRQMSLGMQFRLLRVDSYCFCHELTLKEETLVKILDIKMKMAQVI